MSREPSGYLLEMVAFSEVIFDTTSMCGDEEPIQIIGIEWNFQTRAER